MAATSVAIRGEAHALKQAGLATLIGERTAGRMLMALPQPLGGGRPAVVPEADYVAADGTRLEGVGVRPHIEVSTDDVVLAVADRIGRDAPSSAEFLRGISLEALRRLEEAERAYRRAVSLAESHGSELLAAWRATPHRRLARLLGGRRETEQAAEHWRQVLRYLPVEVEALEALRRNSESLPEANWCRGRRFCCSSPPD